MSLLHHFLNGASFALGAFATVLFIAFVLRRDRKSEHAQNIAHATRCEFLLQRKNEILLGMASDVRRFVDITEETIQGTTRERLILNLASLKPTPAPEKQSSGA